MMGGAVRVAVATARENKGIAIICAVLLVTGSCSYFSGQRRHDLSVQHSDTRWHDLDGRLDRVEYVCGLREKL